MPENPSRHNTRAIRELLLAAFTAGELRRFCQDRPVLRPILARFGPDHGLDDMVAEAIDYCETQDLFDELLAEVEKFNPRQYAHFESRLPLSGAALSESPCPYRGLAIFDIQHSSTRPTTLVARQWSTNCWTS